eukprot:UN04049
MGNIPLNGSLSRSISSISNASDSEQDLIKTDNLSNNRILKHIYQDEGVTDTDDQPDDHIYEQSISNSVTLMGHPTNEKLKLKDDMKDDEFSEEYSDEYRAETLLGFETLTEDVHNEMESDDDDEQGINLDNINDDSKDNIENKQNKNEYSWWSYSFYAK